VNLFLLVLLIAVMAIPVMRYFEAVTLSMPFDATVFVVPTAIFSLLATSLCRRGNSVGERSLRKDF